MLEQRATCVLCLSQLVDMPCDFFPIVYRLPFASVHYLGNRVDREQYQEQHYTCVLCLGQ